jgi:hypothetical protein
MTNMFQCLHTEQSGPKWQTHSWLIFARLESLSSILMIKVKSRDAWYLCIAIAREVSIYGARVMKY